MRILVTGAFGWTAIAIIQALRQAKHEITAFDVPTSVPADSIRPLLSQIRLGDISNFEQVNVAAKDIDAIVHLAVAIGHTDYEHPHIPFAVNVRGTYNVFEVARTHQIQRIVLTSSAPVHLQHSGNTKLSALADWKSDDGHDHLYDLTKRLQEEIARDYCQTFAMNAVTLRAGHIVDGKTEIDPDGEPLSTLSYCRGGWVCRYDLAAACVKALELDSKGYNAFHVIGARRAEQHFDIARTEEYLGLTFRTRFEQYE